MIVYTIMRSEPPILEIDDELATAINSLAEQNSDDMVLLKVKPPSEGNEGMDAAPSFLESVHFLEKSRSMLISEKNSSPICGLEMWYEGNKTKFTFKVPDETLAQEYRQQLSAYYDGCEISEQTPNEGMFLRSDPDKNEAVAVSDIFLNKHYFYPPSNPSSEDNELDSDPFKRLISEIDSKDDTRVLYQVLYKPVDYDWTEGQRDTIETFAKKVQNKGGFKTKYWGMKVEEVDETGIWDSAASEMKSRINKPAFGVDIRLCVITRGQTQERANQKAKSRYSAIMNGYEHLYQAKTDQKPVTRKYSVNEKRNARETLVNMIERKPSHISKPTRLHDYVWEKITPGVSTIIMTAEELAGFVHLPSPDSIASDSVSFAEQMVAGNVPSEVEGFEVDKNDEESKSVDIDEAKEKLKSMGQSDDDSLNSEDDDDSMNVLDDG